QKALKWGVANGLQSPERAAQLNDQASADAAQSLFEPVSTNPPLPLGGQRYRIDPREFKFHEVLADDGEGPSGGWQETDCVLIRFLHVDYIKGIQYIDAPVKVGLPLRNRTQGKITQLRINARRRPLRRGT